MRLCTDRTYRYPCAADELWTLLGQVDAYPEWWPWLRDFDGAALAPGEVWACTVQPPVPYTVSFRVRIDGTVAPREVAASIDGDIAGTATIGISPVPGGGSRLRLRAELGPRTRSLQALSIVARPLVTFGHHWILDTGARQFAAGLGGAASGHLEDDTDAE